MSTRVTGKSGFTALEVLISVGLMVLSMAAALSGWLYIMQGERMNSIQMELDIDVRSAMEWVKADLRLSSMDHVYFYPEGPGPYSGISMPVAVAGEDGLVELDTNTGKIVWHRTVIYHVWESIPNELRVTTFYHRDTDLPPEDRQEQINNVVSNGNGDGTFESEYTNTTQAIFKNLFHWNLAPQGGVVDAYNDEIGVRRNYSLGSAVLGPGSHTFTFTAYNTNEASAGLNFGLDDLTVSPCGAEREAEAQLPATQESGATCATRYQPAGSWGGNYDVLFDASGIGDYFVLTMENDRWEETNFKHSTCQKDNTVVQFDPNATPIMDYIVCLAGVTNSTNWIAWAQGQTLSTATSGVTDEIKGCAVRVLLRGSEMESGGYIDHDGGNVRIRFDAGGAVGSSLKISGAFIAEAADHTMPGPNARSDVTATRLYFNGASEDVTLGIWDDAWAWPWAGTAFPIEKEKSYLVTFLVALEAGKGCPEYFRETLTNMPGSYVIWHTNSPNIPACQDANWIGTRPYYVTNRIYVVKFMETTYATNGTFTSQILDTHLDAPEFTQLTWNAVKPAGTRLGFQVRSGDQADLSDAPGWSNLTVHTISPAAIDALDAKRYVQWRAILDSNSATDFTLAKTPKLKDVTVKWTGENQLTDIGASLTTGPDYGVYRVTVDGNPLVRGVVVDLEIYEDVTGFGGKTKRLTSAMRAVEIEPRNTGK